jgi:hypothetical protein
MTIPQSTADRMNAIARDPHMLDREFAEAMSALFCPHAAPMPDAPEPMTKAEEAEQANVRG